MGRRNQVRCCLSVPFLSIFRERGRAVVETLAPFYLVSFGTNSTPNFHRG
jgi:hypothetical protein